LILSPGFAKLFTKGGLMEVEIKEQLKTVLEQLHRAGATYADCRYLERETESITVRNEQVAALSRNSDRGFGIRALYKGSWGFAASAQLTEANVEATAKRALEIAKASRLTQREPVKLDESPAHVDSYKSAFKIDPFAVPLDKKLELLFAALKVFRQDKRIQMAEGTMRFYRTKKLFLSSEGAEIAQDILESGAGIVATAIQDSEVQKSPDLAALELETGKISILKEFPDDTIIDSLDLSPDGKQLVLSLWKRGGFQDIYTMPADGG